MILALSLKAKWHIIWNHNSILLFKTLDLTISSVLSIKLVGLSQLLPKEKLRCHTSLFSDDKENLLGPETSTSSSGSAVDNLAGKRSASSLSSEVSMLTCFKSLVLSPTSSSSDFCKESLGFLSKFRKSCCKPVCSWLGIIGFSELWRRRPRKSACFGSFKFYK